MELTCGSLNQTGIFDHFLRINNAVLQIRFLCSSKADGNRFVIQVNWFAKNYKLDDKEKKKALHSN